MRTLVPAGVLRLLVCLHVCLLGCAEVPESGRIRVVPQEELAYAGKSRGFGAESRMGVKAMSQEELRQCAGLLTQADDGSQVLRMESAGMDINKTKLSMDQIQLEAERGTI